MTIPKDMEQAGLFCLWRYDEKHGKVPFNVYGMMAKSTDKQYFTTFSKCVEALPSYDGLGFGVFDDWGVIDLDHCVSPDGVLDEQAQDIMRLVPSYAELSPSRTGVHIFFRGAKAFDKEKYYIKNTDKRIEIYLGCMTARFVTVTGQSIRGSLVLQDTDLTPLLEKYMRRGAIVTQGTIENKMSSDPAAVQEALGKDRKLASLWFGTAPGAGSNESELDMALCCKLAYYLNGDKEAIDAAFRSSPYYASKDGPHKAKWETREDYREQTVSHAIGLVAPVLNEISGFQEQMEKKHSEPAPEKRTYTLDDTGNAHRFIDNFGEDLRYNTDNKCWMAWNGSYWQMDVSEKVKEPLEQMTVDMVDEAMSMPPEMQTMASRNIAYLRSRRGKDNCLAEAEHIGDTPVTNASFDTNGWLINTMDGIVDLHTGEIRPSEREDMMMKTTHCTVDMEHEPVRFIAYLKDILRNHPETYGYIQKLFGYGITDSLREQKMYFLYGDGNDGKSLLLDVVCTVLGDYAWTAKSTLLTEQINQNKSLTQIALMKGRRFISVEEFKPDDRLDESLLKEFTSGLGEITGKFLYANEFNFHFYGKLFMATNYKPIIRGTDNGIWRRIVLIPFDRALKESEVNKDLKQELLKEAPQILGWLVKGCLLYQKEGLEEPACVRDMVSEYRTEQDKVAGWIEDRCDISDKNAVTNATELFQDFLSWCNRNNEYRMSQTMFGRSMGKKFKKRNIGSGRVYYGIRLSPQAPDMAKARVADEYDNAKIEGDKI